MGWTRGDIEATIRLVTQEQRQALARRVRAEMERQNLDNVRLSRKSGVSEKTISRLINAKMAPRYSTLERVSQALGLKANDLWTSIGHEPTPPSPEETPDPFARDGTDADRRLDTDAQLTELRREVADVKDQLGQLVGLLTGDPTKTAVISDALVRALERAMSQRAREAGKPGRPRPPRPPEEEERPAA